MTRFRRPHIKRVRHFLFVAAAVGQPRQRAALALVESPCTRILLEHPELETIRPLELRLLEQLCPRLCAEARRMHIKMVEPVAMERGEAYDAVVAHRDERLE